MNVNDQKIVRRFYIIAGAMVIVALAAIPAISVPNNEYAALKGVKSVKTVFDVSLGSPETANVVFWAVKNVNDDQQVRALSQPPQVAVVFHGPAVKLISTARKGFKDSDNKALDEFADMIRQMKKEGVTFEVCDYALNVMGVDPATIMPEVDHVGNGFISIAGYQAQGYSVITIK
ncbi:MAG: DsrE family protein [Desulfobacteraceae bacterium]|jgi:intracellular sulfur oxidation DsrE/DsrF family protein